jgi:site-specific DNA recombinase
MYLGEINHRDKSYAGIHEAMIDRALFDAVEAQLDENLGHRKNKRARHRKLSCLVASLTIAAIG